MFVKSGRCEEGPRAVTDQRCMKYQALVPGIQPTGLLVQICREGET
jgi:hypothetical protein